MRLPYAKVWRAFPELDRFSDAECARFVQRAPKLGRLIASAAVFSALSLFNCVSTAWWKHLGGQLNDVTFLVVLLSILVLVPGVAALWIRDRMLIRSVSRMLTRAHCERCDYSLLGLQVADGRVICPECGSPFVLADHGMTPGDLIAGTGGVDRSDRLATSRPGQTGPK